MTENLKRIKTIIAQYEDGAILYFEMVNAIANLIHEGMMYDDVEYLRSRLAHLEMLGKV